MPHPIYVVDAFTSEPFAGNPAGVCLLGSEVDARWMQRVAAEMKHPETAFVRAIDDGFELRWFTPTVEVDLCGHATLASAHVLWESGRLASVEDARFHTRSGLLVASLQDQIRLNFPAMVAQAAEFPVELEGLTVVWSGKNHLDWLVEVESEDQVRRFVPDFVQISEAGLRGLTITARIESADDPEFDFVSRFFAPLAGLPEDPVTGSAHCCLGPYWAPKLGKTRMKGFQASSRGGVVGVEVLGGRVALFGDAVTILHGELRC